MKLSPRNKLILTAAGVVVLVAALVLVLVVPQVRRLGEMRFEIEAAIDRMNAAQTLLEQRREIRSRASVTDAKLIQLAVSIPENPDLPSLIIDLQDTAYDAGVVIMSITPGEPEFKEKAAYVGLPLTVEVWGTWADTVDFMQRLNTMERALRTSGYTVEVLPEPQQGATTNEAGLKYPPYYQVRTTLQLTAYVIPSPEASATPAVPSAPEETTGE